MEKDSITKSLLQAQWTTWTKLFNLMEFISCPTWKVLEEGLLWEGKENWSLTSMIKILVQEPIELQAISATTKAKSAPQQQGHEEL